MQRVVIRNLGTGSRDRWVRGYQWASSQPGWVARLALLTFLIIVTLPIALLVILALLAATVVFGGLALTHGVVTRIRRMISGHEDGRSNVRVIRRSDPDA